MQATSRVQSIGSGLWAGVVFIGTWLARVGQYIFSLQWIVDIVRWLIGRGGLIAESAFLLATLFVTLEVVANKLVTWIVWSPDFLSLLNQLCLTAFTALPELIIFQAIAITFDHWQMVIRNKDRIDCLAWAIAFTIPTVLFLVLTIITICSFINIESVARTTVTFQSGGIMLTIRCLTGWWYGMCSALFAKRGKKGYTAQFDLLQTEINSLRSNIAKLVSENTELLQQNEKLVFSQNDLQAQLEGLRVDLVKAKTRKVTTNENTNSQNENTNFVKTRNVTTEQNTKLQTENTNIATERKVTTEKKANIKKVLREMIIRGEKVNYRKVAKESKVSYGMVCKYADEMLTEIKSEQPKRLHVVGE